MKISMDFNMVHLHLSYGLLARGFDRNRIIKQKTLCQNNNKVYVWCKHTTMNKKMDKPGVLDMLPLNWMKLYNKYKRNEVPDCFASFNLHTQGSSHDYNTRQRDDIRTNKVRINLTENVFGIIYRKR